MDNTFNSRSPEVIQIRKNTYHPTRVAPVLRIVTLDTIEHVILCLSPEVKKSDPSIKTTLAQEEVLRRRIGQSFDHHAFESLIKKTANWIANKCEGSFDVPELPALFPSDLGTTDHSEVVSQDKMDLDNAEKRKRQVCN